MLCEGGWCFVKVGVAWIRDGGGDIAVVYVWRRLGLISG